MESQQQQQKNDVGALLKAGKAAVAAGDRAAAAQQLHEATKVRLLLSAIAPSATAKTWLLSSDNAKAFVRVLENVENGPLLSYNTDRCLRM